DGRRRAGRGLGVDDRAAGTHHAARRGAVAVHLRVADGYQPVVHDPRSDAVGSIVVLHRAVTDHRVAPVGDTARCDRGTLSAGTGRGRVPIDLTVDHLQVRRSIGTALVAARDAATVQRGVAVDLTVADGGGAQQVLDASAAGVRSDVAVDLAVVDGQHGLAAQADVVATRDSS